MLMMATYTGAHEMGDAAYHQVLSNASKTGVCMRGVYVNLPARTVYFLFEADDPEQIAAVFQPILSCGQIESVPVIDRLAL